MFAVEVYAAIRHFVMIEKNSQRDAARVFGLIRETVSKMCRFSAPPGYTRVKVLRLMEAMPMDGVAEASSEAIRLGAVGFDVIKLIALSRIERRPLRLDVARYPHLLKMDVRTTAAADYAVLVAGQAA